MNLQDLFESQQICPKCGGPAFSSLVLAEKKDACYNKVRSRYKVWPSAYASGALVQCRKKGAANWGNTSKNESVAEGQLDELSPETLKSYHKKAVDTLTTGSVPLKKFDKRETGAIRAFKKAYDQKGVAEGREDLELYGLRVGDTVRATIGLKKVQGDVIDIFPETQQVELLLRGANAGRTVTVDVQDTQKLDERALNEFDPTPQLAPPEIDRDKPVDVVIYGRMPEHFRAEDVWAALEEVLPQEYPRRPNNDGPAQHKTAEIAKNGGAVVTTKPLSVANKLVKTFQTYGIRARID